MDANTINGLISGITWQQIVVFIFCSGWVVEIVPVFKWNPITSALKWIGNKLNGDLKAHLDAVEKENDMRRMRDLKSEILVYSRSLKRFDSDGMADDFDEEDHDRIFEVFQEYMNLINKYKLTNGKTIRAMTMINEHSRTRGYGTISLEE